MTLKELLRQHTCQIQDALTVCEEQIRSAGSQKRAESAHIDSLQKEIDSKQLEEESLRHHLAENQAQIRELERKIEELRDKEKGVKQTIKEAAVKTETAILERKKTSKRTVDLEHDISSMVLEKQHLKSSLWSGCLVAFKTYLKDIEIQLARSLELQEERGDKETAKLALEKARHEKPEVMDLYEAKVEIQKLLGLSNVKAVRNQLEQQLQRIESEIEKMFPGALSVTQQTDRGLDVVELFAVGEPGSTRIFLPISARTWESLRDNQISHFTTASLRLVWALAKGLGLDSSHCKLVPRDDFIYLETKKDLKSISATDNVSMQLPGSSAIALSVSKIPEEIEEALSHEDST